VLRAVQPAGARAPATPVAPVRLGPKRALLAAMASVVLLIQIWIFSLARSHEEKSRPAPPEPELTNEERLRTAPPGDPALLDREPRSPEEARAEQIRARER